MKKTIVAAVIGAALSALPGSAFAASNGASPLAQCWTPQQLNGTPDEKAARPTRNDTAMPSTAGLQLTPTTTIGTVRRVKLPPGRKLVALTFDLCEAVHEIAGYDAGVIDYLRAHNVKATLFAGGKWLLDHPDRAAQLMADPRFEIGSHGWAHVNLHVAKGQAMTDEILGGVAAYGLTRDALAQQACVRGGGISHTPKRPKLFRYPFGTCHAEAMQAVADAGMIAIQWDIVTGDPDRKVTAEAIARSVIATAKPGSIVVAHANGRGWQTAAALAILVPEMRKRGFEFVTVSELMAAGTPEIAPTCYERRPGDNDRYDKVQIRRDQAAKQGAGSKPAQ